MTNQLLTVDPGQGAQAVAYVVRVGRHLEIDGVR